MKVHFHGYRFTGHKFANSRLAWHRFESGGAATERSDHGNSIPESGRFPRLEDRQMQVHGAVAACNEHVLAASFDGDDEGWTDAVKKGPPDVPKKRSQDSPEATYEHYEDRDGYRFAEGGGFAF